MIIAGNISVQIVREDDCFVAYCPELELSTHGESIAEAKKNFIEVLDIFMKDVAGRGSLPQVLEECGWVKVTGDEIKWVPPPVVAREEIPIHFSF